MSKNDRKYVKVRRVQGDDEDDDDDAPVEGQVIAPHVHDPTAPSLAQVMDVLGQIQLSIGQIHERFDFMDRRLDMLNSFPQIPSLHLFLPLLSILQSPPHLHLHWRPHLTIPHSFSMHII